VLVADINIGYEEIVNTQVDMIIYYYFAVATDSYMA
jgi:hypothetical protein